MRTVSKLVSARRIQNSISFGSVKFLLALNSVPVFTFQLVRLLLISCDSIIMEAAGGAGSTETIVFE